VLLFFKSENKMRNILRNRMALSTVVTTLIILVVSVLLAGVVTYFAINVTSTRVQEESLHLTKQHVWYNAASGQAQAAIMIINTGGRDVVLDKIAVRGQESDWDGASQNVTYLITSSSVSNDLTFISAGIQGYNMNTMLGLSGTNNLADASTDITLQSGKTLIMYISSPDSITVNDIGLTVAITVFTSQAMYYKETNVQAYVA
jgi:hypothetical protein